MDRERPVPKLQTQGGAQQGERPPHARRAGDVGAKETAERAAGSDSGSFRLLLSDRTGFHGCGTPAAGASPYGRQRNGMDLQTEGEDSGDEPHPVIALSDDAAEEIRAGCGTADDG